MKRCEHCKAYMVGGTAQAQAKDSSFGDEVCIECDIHLEEAFEMDAMHHDEWLKQSEEGEL